MRYRFAKPADLETLLALLPPSFEPSPRVRESLVELWRSLIADGSSRITVVEDPEQPASHTVQAIGASAFVNDNFVRAYLADPYPNLSAEIYERILEGQSPLLSEREIGVANSGDGLNLVMLHFALRNPNLDDAKTQQVMVAVNAAFFFFYGGYRLKLALQEVYGRQAAEYMKAGGFHIVSDFNATVNGHTDHSRDVHPYLLLLRKDQVQPSVVNPLSFLFYPVAPHIHFSPAEQKLLELALLNKSDLEISKDLGVSLDAVKKAWRRAFERATTKAPNLLGADEGFSDAGQRGTEKRRHLLEYLRIHLEELRPVERGRRTHRSGGL
jgi:hypothetical protein